MLGMSGDSLSVFLFLASAAVACVIGAFSAPAGWRTRALWGGAVMFGASAAIYAWRPGALPISMSTVTALTPALVVGVVALMLRLTPPPAPAPLPAVAPEAEIPLPPPAPPKAPPSLEDRIRAKVPSLWKPDMTMPELGAYVANKTRWRPDYGTTVTTANLSAEIHKALYSGKITAWGRLHPDAEEVQIATGEWDYATLDRLDGYAHLQNISKPVYGLRFARGEVEACWPPKK